ncbi:hypothetical protein L484_011819 [Morus notabilis]|uniref:Uncharacterized protein n=1 Tax=Morus notabilis TaxID=981085 RepID=W9S6F8_9ROSA|nr:hypothetical protein L484_011819 [Morus notabilis]
MTPTQLDRLCQRTTLPSSSLNKYKKPSSVFGVLPAVSFISSSELNAVTVCDLHIIHICMVISSDRLGYFVGDFQEGMAVVPPDTANEIRD